MSAKPWDAYLTDADRAVLARGRFGQTHGLRREARGRRDRLPALHGRRARRSRRALSLLLRRSRLGGGRPDRGDPCCRASGRRAGLPDALRSRSEWRGHRRLRAASATSCTAPTGASKAPRAPSCCRRSDREPGDIVFVKKKPSALSRHAAARLPDRPQRRHAHRRRRRDQQLRARDRLRLRVVQLPHDRSGRRGVRPAADLARDQPLRHGSAVRRRRHFGRRSHRRAAAKGERAPSRRLDDRGPEHWQDAAARSR